MKEQDRWDRSNRRPCPTPSNTLGDRGDQLHWSTFSVIEMGKRYAAEMLEVGHY
jgi:hypothetical protein